MRSAHGRADAKSHLQSARDPPHGSFHYFEPKGALVSSCAPSWAHAQVEKSLFIAYKIFRVIALRITRVLSILVLRSTHHWIALHLMVMLLSIE